MKRTIKMKKTGTIGLTGLFSLALALSGCLFGDDSKAGAKNPTVGSGNEKGLVAYWSFDEAQGDTASDASGNHNPAKLLNGPSRVSGIAGRALQFNGTSNYLEIPPSPSLNSIKSQVTIMAWIKTDFSKRGAIVENWFYDKTASPRIGKRAYLCTVESGKGKGRLSFNISLGKKRRRGMQGGGGIVKSTSVVAPNKWVHLAFVSDGSQMKIFIDGQLDAVAKAPAAIVQSNRAIHIGAWQAKEAGSPSINCFFKGIIDEVKIYNRALNGKEISAEYTRVVGSGGIAGKVTDKKGNPVRGATVACSALATVTGTAGQFKLANVPAADNVVKVSKTGYISKTLKHVKVGKNKVATMAVALKKAGKVVYVATDGSGDYNCDGVKDQVEINEAIETVRQMGGGTVHLKSGTYIVNERINLCSNLVFTGEGEDKTILKIKDQNNTPQWSVFLADHISNTTVTRFKVDGNWRGQRGPGGIGINSNVDGFRITSSDNVTFDRVTCYDLATDGFEFSHSKDCTVRYSKAIHCGHDGMRAIYCDRITFSNNHAEAHGTGNTGVRLYTSSDCVVENNYLNVYGFGIELEVESAHTQKGNVYRNNYIEANFGIPGIWMRSQVGMMKDAVFTGNIVAIARLRKPEPETSSGIAFETSEGGKIRNMKVINNIFNEADYGIHLKANSDISGVVAKNNIISNNRKYGIFGKVESSYNNFWNNKAGNYTKGAVKGKGDISADPMFVNPPKDFHLRAGSPCIDAGDPKSEYSNEPAPNGGRINMGAYGNTAGATKSSK